MISLFNRIARNTRVLAACTGRTSFLATMLVLAALCWSGWEVRGQSSILWDENRDGPLSNDFEAPTHLGALQVGTNSITGAVQIVPIGGNYLMLGDVFIVSVPNSMAMRAMWYSADQNTSVWIEQEGYARIIGGCTSPTNGELMAQMGLGAQPPGVYDLCIKNEYFRPWTTSVNYRLDLVVEPVPEPGTISLVATGAACLALLLRRKRA
jgi:hypothetical protein